MEAGTEALCARLGGGQEELEQAELGAKAGMVLGLGGGGAATMQNRQVS